MGTPSSTFLSELTEGLTRFCSMREISPLVTPARRASSRWDRPNVVRTLRRRAPTSMLILFSILDNEPRNIALVASNVHFPYRIADARHGFKRAALFARGALKRSARTPHSRRTGAWSRAALAHRAVAPGSAGVRLVAGASDARQHHPRQHRDNDGAADHHLHLGQGERVAARGSDGNGHHGTPPRQTGLRHTAARSHRGGAYGKRAVANLRRASC